MIKEMPMNEIREQADHIKTLIECHCQELLYHPFDEYREVAAKILNVNRCFYHNILRYLRKQPAIYKISLEQNLLILNNIYSILCLRDTIPNKLKLISKLLGDFNFYLDDFY